LQRSINFKDDFEEFGIGLLILPSLVNLLDGKINATVKSRKKHIGSKASSVISGLSQFNPNDVTDPGSRQQILAITLHL
jgi:hypothetical protein